jgi:hypothetical protein
VSPVTPVDVGGQNVRDISSVTWQADERYIYSAVVQRRAPSTTPGSGKTLRVLKVPHANRDRGFSVTGEN